MRFLPQSAEVFLKFRHHRPFSQLWHEACRISLNKVILTPTSAQWHGSHFRALLIVHLNKFHQFIESL